MELLNAARGRERLGVSLAGTGLAALLNALAIIPAHATGPQCAALAIPGQFGANVVVDSAATAVTPVPHCNVNGRINPRISSVDGKSYAIGFNLRLPDSWNSRFLRAGGSGTDGAVACAGDPPPPLGLGFATTCNDGGHEDAPSAPNNDDDNSGGTSHFGIDPQARIDYGYNAMVQNALVAKQIIQRYYGQIPQYSYFAGCSNGGREGFMASQRFPDLFDGIVSGSPGFDLPQAAIAAMWNEQALAAVATSADIATGQPNVSTSFSVSDLGLAANAILAACDILDGAADGMVSNFAACTSKLVYPKLAAIQCSGAKTATCLSAGQINALKRITAGPRNSRGAELYAFDSDGDRNDANRFSASFRAWPWDPGIATVFPQGLGYAAWMMGLLLPGPTNTAIDLSPGAGAVAMIFMTPPQVLPTSAFQQFAFQFNFDTQAPLIFNRSGIYTQSAAEFITAAATDLRAFRDRGSKMIIYHGTADGAFSIVDTARWYQLMNRRMNHRAENFARLFSVPGMTHCGGGPTTSQFDPLTPLVNWVENRIAPDTILAAAPAGTPWPGRTRPLCPYPAFARYNGSGDINDAANFTSTRPERSESDFDDN